MRCNAVGLLPRPNMHSTNAFLWAVAVLFPNIEVFDGRHLHANNGIKGRKFGHRNKKRHGTKTQSWSRDYKKHINTRTLARLETPLIQTIDSAAKYRITDNQCHLASYVPVRRPEEWKSPRLARAVMHRSAHKDDFRISRLVTTRYKGSGLGMGIMGQPWLPNAMCWCVRFGSLLLGPHSPPRSLSMHDV